MDATARRRWFGVLVLVVALALLVAGDTVLKGRLGPVAFLAYWLVCLALTGIAVFVAMLDFRALRFRMREENRRLFENTLKQIESDAEAKQRGGKAKS
jgi:hypothetical protein